MMTRPRRLTIGLGIGLTAVRAVAVRSNRIAWALERARADEPLERTIGLLLAEAPLPRWARPKTVAAVGPWHAQTKRLAGLPPGSDSARLGGLVRESASRFFLKNGIPLVTTCRQAQDGAPWGAALEQPVLDAIEQACRARRVKLEAVVPTVAVLGRIADDPSVPGRTRWRDGDLLVDLTFEAGELVMVRRAGDATDLTSDECARSIMLDALGPDGSRFADALGAARSRPDRVLAWRGRRYSRTRTATGWRLAIAVIATIVAGMAWLAARGVAAGFAERNAMARLTRLAPLRRDVAFAEREFAKLMVALNEVAAFDGPRYPMSPLLADLARALPDESALVTLRVARDAGNLVALTPRAAVVLTKLETIPGVEAAEIVGPVTREVVAGKVLERVTVRFRVSPAERRAHRHGARGGA